MADDVHYAVLYFRYCQRPTATPSTQFNLCQHRNDSYYAYLNSFRGKDTLLLKTFISSNEIYLFIYLQQTLCFIAFI